MVARVQASTSRLTHRRILKVAVPVVLSNATVPILGAVDTGVVGQLGSAAAIGAVGVGAITLGGVYWLFGFLRMGTAGLAAQAVGAGDEGEVAALLTRVLIIAMAAGFALIALQSLIFAGAFWLTPASAEVEALAWQYMAIRIYSAPAAIAAYGLGGWLVARERTMGLFWLQFITNGVNIILSIWFVLGFGWGVAGVAWATLVAEIVGLGVGLWLVRDGFQGTAWRDWFQVFDRARLVHMAVVNTDILIRSLILMLGFWSFLTLGAQFGDDTLAANQVLLQFLFITAHAMDGFAFAAESFVGQAMGAKSPSRVRRAALMTSVWGAVTCAVLALGFAIAGPWLIDVMATADGVRETARSYLFWMVLAPFLGCASWMLDGIFIGATRSRDMRNMMILSGAIYAAALWLSLPVFENHGLWGAMVLFFAVRGITLGLRYRALEQAARP